jgi:hypothetical protein
MRTGKGKSRGGERAMAVFLIIAVAVASFLFSWGRHPSASSLTPGWQASAITIADGRDQGEGDGDDDGETIEYA